MDIRTVLLTCNAHGLGMKHRHLFMTLCAVAGEDGSVDISTQRLAKSLGATAMPSWITEAILFFAEIGIIDLGSTGDIGNRIECIPQLLGPAV